MTLALVLLLLSQGAEGFGGGGEEDDALVRAKAIEVALRKRLAEDRVRLKYLANEEGSLLRGLYDLDRRLVAQHRRAAALSDDRRRLEVRMSRAEEELAANREELERLRHDVGLRAAAMLRLKKTPLSGLLSRSRSPAEHRRTKERLRLVLAFDAALVTALVTRAETARALRGALQTEGSALEETSRALEAEIGETLELRAERDALLLAIRREKKLVDRLAREIRAAATAVKSEIGVVRGVRPPPPPAPGGLEAQEGRLPWPVAGRVEVPFGKQVDPETGMVLNQRGIDLRAPFGRPVQAVYPGVVRHAREVPGFGRLVLLEHAGRWYSAYGHLSEVSVKLGDELRAGDALGAVGDSGSTKGPFLYFELRRGRRPVDPLRWLAE